MPAATATLWTFDNPADRLSPASGPGVLSYYDPTGSGWGPMETAFGTAGDFGLPALPGGDSHVMRMPACAPDQGYRVTHGGAANGPYGDTQNRVSNYTLILDVLYPSASDGVWRALYQTDVNNGGEAELYVRDAPSGGIGTINVYHGSILPDTWHRIALVMQSAPGEGKCQRFIDGRFVGGIGSSGSGLDARWALLDSFLLFTDNDAQTADGYVSGVFFTDRAMTMEEIQALGGPHAAGASTPGDPAPALSQVMPRPVGVIGHRGGYFCCAPDNTLAAVQSALDHRVPVIEIDTRLSADGFCVLMHDSTVDRTTDGTGTVISKTAAQLKTLDAGSWFSPEFAGERIPTVQEVMDLARDRMILYFDLKVPGQIDAIMNALEETTFDPDDCWFWTYDSVSDSAAIRARLPDAKIIWGDPPGNWAADPNYFSTLRARGVYGFDLSVYYGTVNTPFLIAAKQQGFVVSIYTILDPDTMVRNAAAGVDFMETDFPQIMNQLQPVPSEAASGPTPADGADGVAIQPLLTWASGTNATAHRVYFGDSAPPTFVGEQTYDLLPRTNLTADTTYFWRVDEVTDQGLVPGNVWQFTTVRKAPPTNQVYEWTFDRGDLTPSLGGGELEFADGATASASSFGVTDGMAAPHVGGEPAAYLRVPALTGQANGLFLTFTDSGPNGGGVYINQYTWVADVMIPGGLNWTALFNSDVQNNNDADFYVAPDGSLGIGELGYSATGLISPGMWHRIAFAADLAAGTVAYYIDGSRVHQGSGSSLLDQRFSLYSNADSGPDLLLFNEGDTSGVYTHELLVSALAVSDRAVSETEIVGLGGPRAEGIFLRRIHGQVTNGTIHLEWNGSDVWVLQRADSLTESDWQEIPATRGANSYTEPVADSAYFRLAFP